MSEEVKKSEVKRKRGAPEGNRNAIKHGLYSKFLAPEEQEDLSAAAKIGGLEEEIAILRQTIKSILPKEPRDEKLLLNATNTLNRLVCTQQRINTCNRRLFSVFNRQTKNNSGST